MGKRRAHAIGAALFSAMQTRGGLSYRACRGAQSRRIDVGLFAGA
jgi:hypothetical protein